MKKYISVFLTTLLLVSGCMVTSFNPLYEEKDLITNDNLIGEWVGKRALLTFERGDRSSYQANYKDCEDPNNAPQDYSSCTVADFTVHLLKLGNEYYIDMYPRKYMNSDNLFLNLHIRPTHSFAKVVIANDSLQIFQFDYSWMDNYMTTHKDHLDNIRVDNLMTLSASTKDIQSFVLKHSNDPGFFSAPVVLTRKKASK